MFVFLQILMFEFVRSWFVYLVAGRIRNVIQMFVSILFVTCEPACAAKTLVRTPALCPPAIIALNLGQGLSDYY